MSQQKKSPILAAILSFLIVGVGHMYLGKWGRGFAWLGGAIVLGIILAVIMGNVPSYIGLIIAALSAFDAKQEADKLNAGLGSAADDVPAAPAPVAPEPPTPPVQEEKDDKAAAGKS